MEADILGIRGAFERLYDKICCRSVVCIVDMVRLFWVMERWSSCRMRKRCSAEAERRDSMPHLWFENPLQEENQER